MNAVEKYRKGSRSRHLEASWALEQEADAAIAELEAQVLHLKDEVGDEWARAEQAKAKLARIGKP